MAIDWRAAYLRALKRVNTREVAENTTRAYRTLHAYVKGERGIPRHAASELIGYLRSKAKELTAAADEIEAALEREEDE